MKKFLKFSTIFRKFTIARNAAKAPLFAGRRRTKNRNLSVLLAILLLAAFFRLYGINWDQNQHLHPDERFLTMVTQTVKWPTSVSTYLNPKLSPLNPYNAGYSFFVYGTFPLKLVKFFSGIINFDHFDYNNITLVGRLISALFDIGVVYLVYKIGQKVFNNKTGLITAFLYSVSVLPIQLSHFYTVDTFLVFFLTLSFYFLLTIIKCRPESFDSAQDKLRTEGPQFNKILHFAQNDKKAIILSCLLGISFGLALACKISALLFLPIIVLGFTFLLFRKVGIKKLFISSLILVFFSYFAFRFSDPRAFATNNLINPTLNSQFIANINQLKSFSDPNTFFPPAIQWIKTKPIIFPLKNMILWGLGLPLGIFVTAAVAYTALGTLKTLLTILRRQKSINKLTDRQISCFLILFWVLFLFLYQGVQFSKAMRYFYPVYPFLALITANCLVQWPSPLNRRNIKNVNKSIFWFLVALLLISTTAWPFSFISIYSQPHSRVTASEWVYNNIPPESVISCEHWDDCLPLSLKSKNSAIYKYKTETLELYNQDTGTKWQKVNAQLENIDYLIMSSNRLWGSIPKVPEKYPITSKFYEDLFAEKLGFTKVAEITSYPTVPILNIKIPDDLADEVFTVYDHPKVLIYKKDN